MEKYAMVGDLGRGFIKSSSWQAPKEAGSVNDVEAFIIDDANRSSVSF